MTTQRTATIVVMFYPPMPPDGLPNFRPHGGHIYQIFDQNGRKLVGGSFGPDRDRALSWALKVSRDKGFTHYRLPDDTATQPIP